VDIAAATVYGAFVTLPANLQPGIGLMGFRTVEGL
jgi:hypothetical protein